MPWAKLSDDFHAHRAIRRVGLEGAGLFAMSLSYCAKYLTDGFVDDEWMADAVPNARKREALLKRLVEVGLFERSEGGFSISSYLENNPSRAEAEAKRAAQREAGRRTAERRWTDRSRDNSSSRSVSDDLDAPSRPVPVPSRGLNQGPKVRLQKRQLVGGEP
jgi:hypothetical protein